MAYGLLPMSAIGAELQSGQLRHAPLREPALREHLFITVRPQLVLPRSFVLEFGSLIWQEATKLMSSGAWPATAVQSQDPRDLYARNDSGR